MSYSACIRSDCCIAYQQHTHTREPVTGSQNNGYIHFTDSLDTRGVDELNIYYESLWVRIRNRSIEYYTQNTFFRRCVLLICSFR